jgi:lipopolysaccharide transport system ATP-binding protein
VNASPLLIADGLGKAYPKQSSASARARALLRVLAGQPVERQTVLDGIGFRVHPGESLGIIGENGAGKSTLLKLLTGVVRPSWGTVTRQGSIGALLELGAGFDTELSGLHNIRLNANLLGWSRAQVEARLQEIVDFADIGDYIDEPVKHYSSGMVVRLGFAIIAAVRPQLLITDEVLAVGDESFQKKCIRWMEGYLDDGGTLLFVSHSMYHVQKLCKHALWLRHGRVEAYGDVFDVTQSYLGFHERKSAEAEAIANVALARDGLEFRVAAIRAQGWADEQPIALRLGDSLAVDIEIERHSGQVPRLGIGVVRADGTPVFGTTSEIAEAVPVRQEAGCVVYRLRFDALPLLPGSYALRCHAIDPEGIRVFDTFERPFTVLDRTREVGLVRLPLTWLR